MRLVIATILILCATACGNDALEERITDLEYKVYHLTERVDSLESQSRY